MGWTKFPAIPPFSESQSKNLLTYEKMGVPIWKNLFPFQNTSQLGVPHAAFCPVHKAMLRLFEFPDRRKAMPGRGFNFPHSERHPSSCLANDPFAFVVGNQSQPLIPIRHINIIKYLYSLYMSIYILIYNMFYRDSNFGSRGGWIQRSHRSQVWRSQPL